MLKMRPFNLMKVCIESSITLTPDDLKKSDEIRTRYKCCLPCKDEMIDEGDEEMMLSLAPVKYGVQCEY